MTTSSAFEAFQHRCKDEVSQALSSAMGAPPHGVPLLETLFEASAYSVSNGGKRIRPVLVYAAAAAVNLEQPEGALAQIACAVELLHTYSLVHDDLPAMDNDDLRRGQPSCHKAYDEPTAILVGDALQARAFELLADTPGLGIAQRLEMIRILASAAGATGMVGGQAIDVAATDNQLKLQQLSIMHALKTGALIRASLALGGVAANATATQLSALDKYGTHIGLAFQVVDDILDVAGDSQTLGKTSGKDKQANKPTYVQLLGLEPARAEARRLLQHSLAALQEFDSAADHLRELANYIVERNC